MMSEAARRRGLALLILLTAVTQFRLPRAAQGVATRVTGEVDIVDVATDGTVQYTWSSQEPTGPWTSANGGSTAPGPYLTWTPTNLAGPSAFDRSSSATIAMNAASAPAIAAFPNVDGAAVAWQGGPTGTSLFFWSSNSAGPSQVMVRNAAGTLEPAVACSAPAVAVDNNGLAYLVFASCSVTYSRRLPIHSYPLQMLAQTAASTTSDLSWMVLPVPSANLKPETSPAIYIRRQGSTEGEVDVAYTDVANNLQYVFSHVSNINQWSVPDAIAGGIASSPAMVVRSTMEADIVAETSNGTLGFWWTTPGAPWQAADLLGSASGPPSIAVGNLEGASGMLSEWIVVTSESQSVAPAGTTQIISTMNAGAPQPASVVAPIFVAPVGGQTIGVSIGGVATSTPAQSAGFSATVAMQDSAGGLQIATARDIPYLVESWSNNGPPSYNADPSYGAVWPSNVQAWVFPALSRPITIVPLYWGFVESTSYDWVGFVNAFAASSYYAWIQAEYGTPASVSAVEPVTFGSMSLDTPEATPNTWSLTQATLERQLGSAATNGTLPTPTGSYSNVVYVVIIPTDIDMTDNDGMVLCNGPTATSASTFGGYNASFEYVQGKEGGVITPWANYIVLGSPSRLVGTEVPLGWDSATLALSHELVESFSNPRWAYGWIDYLNGNQIADLCAGIPMWISSQTGNNRYLTQRIWSKSAYSCMAASDIAP